jgi:hypothetical protein
VVRERARREGVLVGAAQHEHAPLTRQGLGVLDEGRDRRARRGAERPRVAGARVEDAHELVAEGRRGPALRSAVMARPVYRALDEVEQGDELLGAKEPGRSGCLSRSMKRSGAAWIPELHGAALRWTTTENGDTRAVRPAAATRS